MRTFQVTDSLGDVHLVNADYWNNYDGSVDFVVKETRDADGNPVKGRTTSLFYKPVAVVEIEQPLAAVTNINKEAR